MVGIGTDIVAVARIAQLLRRHGERFLQRCFSSEEIILIEARHPDRRATALAARWAAKEAYLKAVGKGLGAVRLREISVGHDAAGRPVLRLSGTAAAALSAAGGRSVLLSLSHEFAYAVAVVVVE